MSLPRAPWWCLDWPSHLHLEADEWTHPTRASVVSLDRRHCHHSLVFGNLPRPLDPPPFVLSAEVPPKLKSFCSITVFNGLSSHKKWLVGVKGDDFAFPNAAWEFKSKHLLDTLSWSPCFPCFKSARSSLVSEQPHMPFPTSRKLYITSRLIGWDLFKLHTRASYTVFLCAGFLIRSNLPALLLGAHACRNAKRLREQYPELRKPTMLDCSDQKKCLDSSIFSKN